MNNDQSNDGPSNDSEEDTVDTARIYGPLQGSELGENSTSGKDDRNALFAQSSHGEGHLGDDHDLSILSDDSLGSWASDETDIHNDVNAKKRRAGRKQIALLKKQLRPDVMAHLSSSTRLERFQQRRAMLHREALSVNKQFHSDLIKYRNSLRYREEVRELDEQWTLTAIDTGAAGRGMNAGLGVRAKKGHGKYCFDAKAELVMASEVEKALKGAGESISLMRALPPTLRGPELLRVFILDLLGRDTMAAKVMKTKMYANTHFNVVSHTAKITAGVAVVLMNLVMMYIALSLASSKSAEWQKAWFLTVGANIALHLFLNQMVEALLLHYYIPQLVWKEAQVVRQKLLDIVEALFRDTLIGDGPGGARSGFLLPYLVLLRIQSCCESVSRSSRGGPCAELSKSLTFALFTREVDPLKCEGGCHGQSWTSGDHQKISTFDFERYRSIGALPPAKAL